MYAVRYVGILVGVWLGFGAQAQTAYQERPDPNPNPSASDWKAVAPGTYASFASKDSRYAKHRVPAQGLATSWRAKAWKGERIQTQLVVWSTQNLPALTVEVSALQTPTGNRIAAEHIKTDFVRYVLTNSPAKEGCNTPKTSDSALAADVLDPAAWLPMTAQSVRPVWLQIQVPPATPAGTYSGQIRVLGGAKPIVLPYSVQVGEHTLPEPRDWGFHLDLWQNPYAVARVHNVQLWSDAHFAVLKTYMQPLADAGQKVITASIIHDPWNSQTYDPYASMIRWIRQKDGRWTYDYTVFDQWVEFMMSLGITRAINCYSLIPWHLTYRYFDAALGRDTALVAKPGTDAFRAHWQPMLADFAAHLKAKGWYEKTTLAMDERPLEAMQQTLAVIKAAAPDFRVSMAGNYHPEIESSLVDYCLPSYTPFPPDVLARRKKQGFISTFYTACPEAYPNTFTFSPPAESAFMGWYAAAQGLDGFLRWAYNSWPKDPLADSRWGSWGGGDTYFIYPGGRRSIRFERLREGIQVFEKIKLLRAHFRQTPTQQQRLENLLKTIRIADIPTRTAATMLQEAEAALNSF